MRESRWEEERWEEGEAERILARLSFKYSRREEEWSRELERKGLGTERVSPCGEEW